MSGDETRITFCRICEARCGLRVDRRGDRIVRIAPDKANPYTWRDFCAKGRTAAQMLDHPRRVLSPLRRMGDRYEPVSWPEAIEGISADLLRTVERHGRDAIATYSGNPIGFNGANAMFFAAFCDALGSRNRFTVASVDHNNLRAVNLHMYGNAALNWIPDVDQARVQLMIGMNPAVSTYGWIHNVPDGWNRARTAQAGGAELIVVDPVRTATAAAADQHVVVRPGTDWALLAGVLKVIFAEGRERRDAMVPTTGFSAVRSACTELMSLAEIEAVCGVAAADIESLARRFANAPSAFCVAHTGVAHSAAGTVAEWLSHVLNLVTGNVDRPGGRYVQRGYLSGPVPRRHAEVMAAANAAARSRVRGTLPLLGELPLAELADEITTPGPGQVRALIVNSGNPVVAGPEGGRLRQALDSLDVHVVCDLVQRESHAGADWIIPGTHWLERDDLLYFFSTFEERPFVQYGNHVVDPPAGVEEEWVLWRDLAVAMGLPLFGLDDPAAVAAETPPARMRGLVERAGVVDWDDLIAAEHGLEYRAREFGDLATMIGFDDGVVRLAPPSFTAELERLALADPRPRDEGAFVLTNRRSRESMNSWLNELPGLHRRERPDRLEVNAIDAAALGLEDGDAVVVESEVATVEMRVEVSDRIEPGVVVAAHGWGSAVHDVTGAAAPETLGQNRNLLTGAADLDPLSGTPAFSHTAVRLRRATSPQLEEPNAPNTHGNG